MKQCSSGRKKSDQQHQDYQSTEGAKIKPAAQERERPGKNNNEKNGDEKKDCNSTHKTTSMTTPKRKPRRTRKWDKETIKKQVEEQKQRATTERIHIPAESELTELTSDRDMEKYTTKPQWNTKQQKAWE